MPAIRRLSSALINQIAAGEVITRPAAAVKELVENALDAQATHIDIHLEDGGKSAIVVKDDGVGMSPEDLTLCVDRYTTSKLQDLSQITTFGFRGEALAALGSVCRLIITSRERGASQAFCIKVEREHLTPLALAVLKGGTRVEAQDLFFAMPARLKFLKSTALELSHCTQAVKRLALANPHVAFRCFEGERCLFSYRQSDQQTRLIEVLGNISADELLPVKKTQNALSLSGVVGKPVCTQATSAKQFFFVNKRAVQDVCFSAALRTAYQELIVRERHAIAVLFLVVPPQDVDVNVHPAKTEIRFQDVRRIQLFLTDALAQSLRTTEQIGAGERNMGSRKHFVRQENPKPFSRPLASNVLPLLSVHAAHHLAESPASWHHETPPADAPAGAQDALL
ncbi:MAG: DNA mismatch repair endonuclease MutL, partial [Holosporales bacterium]|nr:DNA mismatch repair endonuclease MutL [Holosporales bacterium]